MIKCPGAFQNVLGHPLPPPHCQPGGTPAPSVWVAFAPRSANVELGPSGAPPLFRLACAQLRPPEATGASVRATLGQRAPRRRHTCTRAGATCRGIGGIAGRSRGLPSLVPRTTLSPACCDLMHARAGGRRMAVARVSSSVAAASGQRESARRTTYGDVYSSTIPARRAVPQSPHASPVTPVRQS